MENTNNKKAFTIREFSGDEDPLNIVMKPLVEFINSKAKRDIVTMKKEISNLTNNAQNKKIELGK